jgi:hypothetical protein
MHQVYQNILRVSFHIIIYTSELSFHDLTDRKTATKYISESNDNQYNVIKW